MPGLVAVMALVLVIPVDHEDRAVRAGQQVENLRRAVVEAGEVRAVFPHEAAARALGDVHVDPRAVDVVHENLAAIFRRETVALIDEQARVRVAAAHGVAAAVARVRSLIAEIMPVIGDGFQLAIDERMDRPAAAAVRGNACDLVGVRRVVRAALPLIFAALNHVEEMRNHAGLDEALTVRVEVDAPRIARALGEDLELFLGGMIAPDGGIDPLAPGLRSPRLADARWTEDAVTSVEPAVRAPGEGVQHLVRVGLEVPAVEENLRITGGLRAVPVLHGHEHQVRGRANPHAAETDFKTADQVQLLHEDGAPVELAVAIRVFEDEDAVIAAQDVGELFRRRLAIGGDGRGRHALAFRIRHALGDPEPPAIIDGEGDGLHDVRLAGKEGGLETLGQRDFLRGLRGGQAGELHGVRRQRGDGGHGGHGGHGVGEDRLRRVEKKVVEVDVTPMALLLVHHAHKNLPALVRLEIDDGAAEVFLLAPGRFENDFIPGGRLEHDFHASLFVGAATDEEARPR